MKTIFIYGVLILTFARCNKREAITEVFSQDTSIVIAVISGCIVSRQDTINLVQAKMIDYSAYDSVVVEKQLPRPIQGHIYSVTNDSICVLILKFFGETKYSNKGHPVIIVNMD